jgi:hypothetical protein
MYRDWFNYRCLAGYYEKRWDYMREALNIAEHWGVEVSERDLEWYFRNRYSPWEAIERLAETPR